MTKNNALNNSSYTMTINGAYTLPIVDGSANDLITSDGAGGTYWSSARKLVQQVYTSSASVVTCSGVTPFDDTIPQNTEGTEVITLAITPTSASNYLVIEYHFWGSPSNGVLLTSALFQDSTANAIFASASQVGVSTTTFPRNQSNFYRMVAGTSSATTFKLRVGVHANTFYINGDNAGSRLYGGVCLVGLAITEIST